MLPSGREYIRKLLTGVTILRSGREFTMLLSGREQNTVLKLTMLLSSREFINRLLTGSFNKPHGEECPVSIKTNNEKRKDVDSVCWYQVFQ